ncbi:SGNH/GDSL hydrolase family protein [Atopobiaceae bacterium 24-176]
MPTRLAGLLGREVAVHARGGARLAEQTNPATRLGAATAAALAAGGVEALVLQEMSHGPVSAPERFLESVARLAVMAREAGAVPVVYGTWAFGAGSAALGRLGLSPAEMHGAMQAAFGRAAQGCGVAVANVGSAFWEAGDGTAVGAGLLAADGVHPSEAGSALAASVLAEALAGALGA